jgi:hypothetical protein
MTLSIGRQERGMMDPAIAATGGMEGGGAYNQHAAPQAAGAAVALRLLQDAARTIALPSGDEPIAIVDYGSSPGFNSIAPMRAAIESLRTRSEVERPILVYHQDLPLNDFNALFGVLDRDPQSYLRDAPNVFACAIARSFYERVTPDNFVCLGWSSFSAMWLSRTPMTIPGHFFPGRATGETRDAFEKQAAADWARFLSLRARELRPGGKIVIAVLGMEEDPDPRDWNFLDEANVRSRKWSTTASSNPLNAPEWFTGRCRGEKATCSLLFLATSDSWVSKLLAAASIPSRTQLGLTTSVMETRSFLRPNTLRTSASRSGRRSPAASSPPTTRRGVRLSWNAWRKA